VCGSLYGKYSVVLTFHFGISDSFSALVLSILANEQQISTIASPNAGIK
jgi:hypothetical protein